MSLAWKQAYLEPVVVLLSFSVLWLVYHYSFLTSGMKSFCQRLSGRIPNIYLSSIVRRASGVVLLGLFPFMIGTIILKRQPGELGLSLSIPPIFFAPASALCALLFPVLFVNAKTPGALKKVPEQWDTGYILINSLCWIPYLIAYEFCMRGFLLLSLARSMGAWPAIFTMTAIYMAVHLSEEKGEAAGSLIMGIIFGIFALITKSILIPIIVHIYIALTTDLLALRSKTR